MHPKERYIWVQARILHEADKAVLVDIGMKIWIPKVADIWDRDKKKFLSNLL